VFVVSVAAGQEVIDTIATSARDRGVADAAIVSLIGAVEGCQVSVMPADDPLADVCTTYRQPFELSGTGEIRDGVVHVHCVLGGAGGPVAGHLHWATVEHWFVRAYVVPVGD
jgi:uncharacterized protein